MMKKRLKKLFASALAALLLFPCTGLAGCGKRETEPEPAPAPKETVSEDAEVERVTSLPPASPAIGVGRIMPEVIEQRDILICVDPGHGFEDGGSGENSFFPPDILEKDVTIVVAKHLEEALQKRGFRTVMTHDGETIPAGYNWDGNDRFNPNERVALMNDLAPDLMVSVHTNTAANPEACGAIVFYSSRSYLKENELSGPAAEYIAEAMDEYAEMNTETRVGNEDIYDYASYAVIRDTRPAAVLIELGYSTNEADAEKLVDPEWQKDVAYAIAKGVEQFFDSLENE